MKKIILFFLLLLIPIAYAENYLIVTPQQHFNTIKPLGDYRANEYNVSYYVYQGENATALKSVILSYNPDYVLLAGSTSTIPTLDNNDRNYVNKIGRIGIEYDDFIRQYVNNVIRYETEKQYNMRKVGLIAGSEAIPVTGFRTASFFSQDILPMMNNYTYHTSYCYCSLGCPNAIENAVNVLGASSLVMYTGHSSITGWDAGCGDRLYNRNITKMQGFVNPIVIAFSCSSVRYDYNLFLANRLLFTERDNVGAVAYLGSLLPIGTDGYKLNFSAPTLGEFLEHSNLPSSYVILGDPAITMNEQIIIQNNVSNGSFIIDTNYTYINQSSMFIKEPCKCCGKFCTGGNCDWERREQINSTNCFAESFPTNITIDFETLKESIKNIQLQKYQIIDLIVVLLNKI